MKELSVTLLAIVSQVVAYVAVEGDEVFVPLAYVPWAVAVFACEPAVAGIGPFTGDMVNFVIVGSEQQVQSALTAAEWHTADRDDKQAVLNAIVQTYKKEDY